jgi:GTP-binding protein Era
LHAETGKNPDGPVPSRNGVFHPGEDGQVKAGFRCGYVAIIGLPNVGKSTLLNTILGQKISIVTPKPQTTRHRLSGIHSMDDCQIIFLDTPGILEPKYLLQERMMENAALAMEDADLVLFMVDANDPPKESWIMQETTARQISLLKVPAFLLINKVDRVQKLQLLPMMEFYAGKGLFREIFPVSALKRDGIDVLLKTIVPFLPEHPPLYPLDIVSDHNERFLVSEIIREKICLQCKEEIPYSTAVDIVEFKEREAGKTLISAEIYVERPSQRGIVIGKNGAMLKRIGSMARVEIERFLERPVFLELQVKVREEWRQKKNWLDKLGYGGRTGGG